MDIEISTPKTQGFLSDVKRLRVSRGLSGTRRGDVMDKRTFRRSMWKFFDSVLYQIDCDAAHRAVAELFYMCLGKLYEGETRDVDGWWGEIELEA